MAFDFGNPALPEVALFLVAVLFGGLAILLCWWPKGRAQRTGISVLEERLYARELLLSEKERIIEELTAQLRDTNALLREAEGERRETKARLEAELRSEREKLRYMELSKERLQETFQALSHEALSKNNQAFLQLATASLTQFQEGAKGELEKKTTSIAELVRPLKESLERLFVGGLFFLTGLIISCFYFGKIRYRWAAGLFFLLNSYLDYQLIKNTLSLMGSPVTFDYYFGCGFSLLLLGLALICLKLDNIKFSWARRGTFDFESLLKLTCIFLALSAVLSILGIFDAWLGWDIFPPKIETVFRATFACLVTSGLFGILITMTLSMSRSARLHERILNHIAGVPPSEEPNQQKGIADIMLKVSIPIGLLIMGAWGVNAWKERKREMIFESASAEVLKWFEPKLSESLSQMSGPVQSGVPLPLYTALKSMEGLQFIKTATLYMKDPKERGVMWGYRAWRNKYHQKDGFARFHALKEFEVAMLKSLSNQSGPLERLAGKEKFVLFFIVRLYPGRNAATLRLDGKETENFEEYRPFYD